MDVTLAGVVGELVKTLRGAMTQTELERRSGVKQSTISAIEKGTRKFDRDHLEAILKATRTDALTAFRLMKEIADRWEAQPQLERDRLKATGANERLLGRYLTHKKRQSERHAPLGRHAPAPSEKTADED